MKGQQPDAGLLAEVDRLQEALLQQELAALRHQKDAAGAASYNLHVVCNMLWELVLNGMTRWSGACR